MSLVTVAQSDFSGGELAPQQQAAVALDRYKKSVALCLNWIPTLQGDLVRRPGSWFVGEVKTSGAASAPRLVPFVFSTTQSYVVEIGNNYARFFSQETRVFNAPTSITNITQANPAVVTSPSHGLANGQTVYIVSVNGMTQVNNNTTGYIVAGVTANTFQLQGIDSTGFGTYTSGGIAMAIYEISAPYALADVDGLQYVQSADTLYLVHPKYPPYKLQRFSDGSFAFNQVTFVDGPYLGINTTTTTLALSATSGSVTVTASVGLFAATDVGRLIRFQGTTTWGYLTITAFTDSTHVTVTVNSSPDVGTATKNWQLGRFSATTGYPTCVEFHEGRLWYAGSAAGPDTFDGSTLGLYDNFQPSPYPVANPVLDTNAVSATVTAGNINTIFWMKSTQHGLMMGTRDSEYLVSPGQSANAITPSALVVERQSSLGSAAVQPLLIGRNVLYVQRAALKIREAQYAFFVNGFESTDLTLLARHITQSGVKELAFTREPFPILWALRNDGTIAGCTYERDQQNLRAGWHRHQMGGVSDATGAPAVTERITNIPATISTASLASNTKNQLVLAYNSGTSYDELWMVVKRQINGVTRRYIEFLLPHYPDTAAAYTTPCPAIYLDCARSAQPNNFINSITKANPGVVTVLSTAADITVGGNIFIDGVPGMTQINGRTLQVSAKAGSPALLTLANQDGTPFDTSGFSAFLSGGIYYTAGILFPSVSTFNINQALFQNGLFIVGQNNYLEGQTIGVLANGGPQQCLVTSGNINLSPDGGALVWGFNYNSDLQLLRFEAGAANGSSLVKTQRIHKVGVVTYQEGALQIGDAFDGNMVPVERPKFPFAGAGAKLYTGVSILPPGKNASYSRNLQLCLRVSDPLPATLMAVAPQLETQDSA